MKMRDLIDAVASETERVIAEDDGLIHPRGALNAEEARKRAERERKLAVKRQREQTRHHDVMNDIAQKRGDL